MTAPEVRVRLAADYARGYTVEQLARQYGLGETTVRRALPVRRPRGPAPKTPWWVLDELRRRGYTWPEIADLVGRDRTALIRAYRRHSPG